jgi:tetratricopeptide (TPR) repeat protein
MKSSDTSSSFTILTPNILIYVVLGLVTIFTFYQCPEHEFVYWDDVGYVTENVAVRGITVENIKTAFSKSFIGNYAPIHIVSYMIDYELWGMSPAGFIYTNILLHFLNSLLLYHIFLKLGLQRLGAVLAAFIFIVHPIQVESVVWISQRKNVLSMFFFLISFLGFISFRADDKKNTWLYVMVLISYSLALLTKIAAVILPVAMLLYDHFYGADRSLREKLRGYAPVIAISVLLSAVAIATQRLSQEGAPVAYYGGSGYKTFLTMITVFPQYLLNIFWPRYLSIIYSPPVKESIDGVVVISAVLIALLVAEGIILFRRRSPLIFWYVFFFTAFLPVLQIIPLPTIMQDRYCYFPLIGLCGFIGVFADDVSLQGPFTSSRCIVSLLFMFSVLSLPVLSRGQAEIWKDSVTLFGETAKKAVGSRYGVYENFVEFKLVEVCSKKAEIAMADGNYKAALKFCKTILEISPLNFDALLKVAFLMLNDQNYRAAYRYNQLLIENYPSRFESHYSVGQYYQIIGKSEKARESYQKALELNPGFEPALRELDETIMQ